MRHVIELRSATHPPYPGMGVPLREFEIRWRGQDPNHFIRFGAFYGPPPGSHMGFWRTRAYGLRGLNYRIGSFHRALTFLLHWRLGRTET